MRSSSYASEHFGIKLNLSNFPIFLPICSLFQGHPRTETPLPSYVSQYSDTLPNTSNQTLGSRLCTELGKELMRMDKLLILTTTHQKTKPSPEMQPCWRQVRPEVCTNPVVDVSSVEVFFKKIFIKLLTKVFFNFFFMAVSKTVGCQRRFSTPHELVIADIRPVTWPNKALTVVQKGKPC